MSSSSAGSPHLLLPGQEDSWGWRCARLSSSRGTALLEAQPTRRRSRWAGQVPAIRRSPGVIKTRFVATIQRSVRTEDNGARSTAWLRMATGHSSAAVTPAREGGDPQARDRPCDAVRCGTHEERGHPDLRGSALVRFRRHPPGPRQRDTGQGAQVVCRERRGLGSLGGGLGNGLPGRLAMG